MLAFSLLRDNVNFSSLFWVDPGQPGSTHLTRDPIIIPGQSPGWVLKLWLGEVMRTKDFKVKAGSSNQKSKTEADMISTSDFKEFEFQESFLVLIIQLSQIIFLIQIMIIFISYFSAIRFCHYPIPEPMTSNANIAPQGALFTLNLIIKIIKKRIIK